jgi:hypothetical protein
MKQVMVNGKPWKNFNPEQEVVELKPPGQRFQVVAEY